MSRQLIEIRCLLTPPSAGAAAAAAEEMPLADSGILAPPGTLRTQSTREEYCQIILDKLYKKIAAYKDAAAIHLLGSFLLHEAIKNSLDAHATELKIIFSLSTNENGEEMVTITLLDDGDGTKEDQHEYDYIERSLLGSQKRSAGVEAAAAASPKLGGACRGLLMSAQFITLFADGSLTIGKSGAGKGFELSVTTKNKPATADFSGYIQNFERFSHLIQFLRSDFDPTKLSLVEMREKLKEAEMVLKKAVLEPNSLFEADVAAAKERARAAVAGNPNNLLPPPQLNKRRAALGVTPLTLGP